MKFEKTYTLSQIAGLLELPFKGNPDLPVKGINEIHRVKTGDMVFVDLPKYYDNALNSAASVILIDSEIEIPENKGIIISKDPFHSFNYLLNYFNPFVFSEKNNDQFEVGNNPKIHESVSFGKNIIIGNNVIIFPNVSILDDVQIGNNVIIQAGSIIGSMGFYYKRRESHYERLNSCGKVIIEDDVEIGANCTIDRGVSAETRIKKGTKIDNLVQIGHDTVIGENCLIASQSGVAGCVTVREQLYHMGPSWHYQWC